MVKTPSTKERVRIRKGFLVVQCKIPYLGHEQRLCNRLVTQDETYKLRHSDHEDQTIHSHCELSARLGYDLAECFPCNHR